MWQQKHNWCFNHGRNHVETVEVPENGHRAVGVSVHKGGGIRFPLGSAQRNSIYTNTCSTQAELEAKEQQE